MRSRLVLLAILIALAHVTPGGAQEVVVTGMRVSGDDYSRMPAVVLARRADFLVQLTNDEGAGMPRPASELRSESGARAPAEGV
jgi:hypothetical protein